MSEENFKPEESGRSRQCFAGFFDSKQWSYTPAADRPVIHLNFTGDNARWQCVAIADPKAAHLIFLSQLPCRVPVNRRAQVAELFTRINWGLTHGCFELDVDSSEVRCRTSQPLPSPEIHPDFVAELVFSNLWAVDHFFGTIMTVVYTRVTPRAALAALEAAPRPALPKKSPASPKPRFELN
ncbi:MAG TPA: YbjN domain-containing protein [Verrucomicrobiae bacterium]|nr:YbjN domain-containing protein [Verrucomicrobiae bacterium]